MASIKVGVFLGERILSGEFANQSAALAEDHPGQVVPAGQIAPVRESGRDFVGGRGHGIVGRFVQARSGSDGGQEAQERTLAAQRAVSEQKSAQTKETRSEEATSAAATATGSAEFAPAAAISGLHAGQQPRPSSAAASTDAGRSPDRGGSRTAPAVAGAGHVPCSGGGTSERNVQPESVERVERPDGGHFAEQHR